MVKLIQRIIIAFLLLFFTTLSAEEKDWSGKWHVFWKHGAIVLTLEQHGNDVNGSFEPMSGILQGYIKNNILYAETKNSEGQGKLTLTMGQSGTAFFGNTLQGDWITGVKADADSQYNALSVNHSSPLHVFYSFLKLGNQVRSGHYEALEKALELLYFDEEQQKYPYGKRMALTNRFFYILDACTVEKYDFNPDVQADHYSVVLPQVGTSNTVEVKFVKAGDTKRWRIKVPTEEETTEMLRPLMEARESNEIDPNANLQLTNPRDTMRTFIEQYQRWNKGGKEYVLSTMNLSAVDPAIWKWQAPLLSYYLLGVLDRISEVIYQEIPNDPKSKKPYVHFHHPVGDIVIAPYELEGKTRWQFTPETIGTIEMLFEEMEDVPLKVPARMISENDLYFSLKNIAQSISPLLLTKLQNTALWQIILLGFVLFLATVISYFSKWIIYHIVKRFYLTKRWTDEMISLRFLRPVQMLTFALVLLYGAHQLGLPDFLFSVIKTFSHLLIVLGIAWLVFNLIDIIVSLFRIRAKRKASEIDDILLSLISSILRIFVVVSVTFAVAEILGVPYKTVIAGLGIGGLAFAIAAKDTIANFFGSAIIIADRPFKTGDMVKIGSDMGKIINVGIRSTTIRTIRDTVLTVPNNMITREMIDNYSQREAMRFDTEFFFDLDTSKETLDSLDLSIAEYLAKSDRVDHDKIILTGTNDYTKRGITYGLTFFVKATTLTEYSECRHILITEIAQIIKEHNIELVSINYEYSDDKKN
jgi:small-conductance mechanosensitive channel